VSDKYFHSDDPELEALVNKLITATMEHVGDAEIIFEALQKALVFQMACVCRDCRKDVGRKLKRDIPHMMVEAGALQSAVADELRARHLAGPNTKH
jgi:hypothetical protein